MVASAVLPDRSDQIVAWAHQLLLFPHRLPGLPPVDTIRYGVSFDRRLFSAVGLFDSTLESGEDTEFLSRFTPDLEPIWAPTVVTYHRNARDSMSLLRDQFVRGRRYAIAMYRLHGTSPLTLAKESLSQWQRSKRLAKASLTGRDLELAMASLWLVSLGGIAHALGILLALGSIYRLERK